jgi:hypothetical protein
VRGGQAADVERRDEIEVDHRLEGFEVVRAGLGHRPLGDAAASGGDDDVQAAEIVDRGLQGLLGAREVGDVDRVELPADAVSDGLAVRTLPVEHRDLRAALVQQLGAGTPHPRRAADDDDLLPADLHSDVSFVACQNPGDL